MGNWKPWTYPAEWSIEEHNAVLAALRKAEAECERMGRANNEACDRIAKLERENAEHRSHVSTIMSREAEAKRRVKGLESADPDAWKMPLEIASGYADSSQKILLHANEYQMFIEVRGDGLDCYVSTADAALAALWLASYAQAHGAPVDIGVKPAPIATPDTLEALAEIAFGTMYETPSIIWASETKACKHNWCRVVTAILRAARPTVDVTEGELHDTWRDNPNGYAAILALCNSRIRYSVEVPPEPGCKCDDALGQSCELCNPLGSGIAAPTDAQIEALARVLRAARKGEPVSNVWVAEDVWIHCARAAYAHIGAELAAVTAERDEWIDKHHKYIDLEIKEKHDHFSELRQALECSEDEHWLDAATRLLRERGLYKQYYDAVIDMAIVNWTLDGLSEKDANHAIQRIILQHAQEACDPQVNEELAKREAQIAAVTAERDKWHAQADESAKKYLVLKGSHDLLVIELDDLRCDIDNAVKNAIERLPDFPWKDKTATEAVWGLSLAVKGGLEALDDLRRQLAERTTRPVLVLPDRDALAKRLDIDGDFTYWERRRAQADAALAIFRELNPEGGQG